MAADRQGAAAVEFALIFPLLFVLNIGAAEALQVYQVQRNVAHMAAVMADITAQSRTVTDAELQDILSASLSIIHPFPRTTLQQRVTSLSANDTGTVSQDWTAKKDYNGSSPASVPSGYLGANESVIVTDVIYDYKPTFGLFLPDTIRFTRHAYARPRLTQKVEKIAG
ncbi:MAG: pilus assembly protein [Phenylobacterium sp.]|nr:MAG: pilus assembly protein [Phenylobacterium sp.]